jgi:D-alanine-D-alanine ligase
MAGRIRVGVFAGGISSERRVSLLSAAQVVKILSPEKYDIRLVEVGTDGRWSFDGAVIPFGNTLGLDVAFIAMHGVGAEDGRIQGVFETIGLPYTGSGITASAVSLDKHMANALAAAAGIPVPPFFLLQSDFEDVDTLDARIRATVGYPCVVKPNTSGSSVGVSIVTDFSDVPKAHAAAFCEGGGVLMQCCVRGREVSCAVLGNAGEAPRALPVIEIVADGAFFDYAAKYESTETREICPAELSHVLTARVQELAVHAHELFGCDGLSRSDFIIGEDGVPYFLELNTIPGMTEASLAPQEARAAAISFGELLDIQIEMALRRHDLYTPPPRTAP